MQKQENWQVQFYWTRMTRSEGQSSVVRKYTIPVPLPDYHEKIRCMITVTMSCDTQIDWSGIIERVHTNQQKHLTSTELIFRFSTKIQSCKKTGTNNFEDNNFINFQPRAETNTCVFSRAADLEKQKWKVEMDTVHENKTGTSKDGAISKAQKAQSF